MSNKMAPVGWQGITLRAPADWSLVGVSGDRTKGYFRVDSPVASVLEVKWFPAGGCAPDLAVKAREFAGAMEKASRKSRERFTSKIKPGRDPQDPVDFSWKSDRVAKGRIIYCAECDRVIIAQIVMLRDENITHVIPGVLASIKDHRADGWTDWALYGLELAVPPNYKIEKQTLMSGYLSLTFRNRSQVIVVDRWGFASTLIGENTVEEWFKREIVPDIKGFKLAFEECEIASHPGVRVYGRRVGLKQAVKALVKSVTLHPHPSWLTAFAWKCDESNRLFSVRATRVQDDDAALQVRNTITCHGK
jgi:hypothetical protein